MSTDFWIALSAGATSILAVAAFLTILLTYLARKSEIERNRATNSVASLRKWVEDFLKVYYLPYHRHRDEVKAQLRVLLIDRSMITHAHILGEVFVEPAMACLKSLATFNSLVKKLDEGKGPNDKEMEDTLNQIENHFYYLQNLLLHLQFLDFDYEQFEKEFQSGKLEIETDTSEVSTE